MSISINSLHLILVIEVHHFADDTNLVNFQAFVKTINKQVNHDLKSSLNWLNANEIALNVTETI